MPTLSKRKVALVLSGGGAKAAYHVGVLKAMDMLGIKPDLIVGCSAGALNALVLALGCNSKTLENIWRRLRRQDVFRPRWWWTSVYLFSIFLLVRVIDVKLYPDKIEQFVEGFITFATPDQKFLPLLGLTWVYLIGAMGVLLFISHFLNKHHPMTGKLIEKYCEFLTSAYDNTPLIHTLRIEILRLLKDRARKASPSKWTFSSFDGMWRPAVNMWRFARPVTLPLLRLASVLSVVLALMVLIGFISFHGSLDFLDEHRRAIAALWIGGNALLGWHLMCRRCRLLTKVSRQCASEIMTGFTTGPPTKEIVVSACDLDSRTDWTFFLLKPENEKNYSHVQVARMEGLNINTPEKVQCCGGYNFLNLRRSDENLLPAVIASAAVPFAFPPSKILLPEGCYWNRRVHRFVDGGVGNNAPIMVAMDYGATDIIIVDVNPRQPDMSSYPVSTVVDVVGRTLGTMLTSAVDEGFFQLNDLKQHTNREEPRLYIIRPTSELPVTLLDFGEAVDDVINAGYVDALQIKDLEQLGSDALAELPKAFESMKFTDSVGVLKSLADQLVATTDGSPKSRTSGLRL